MVKLKGWSGIKQYIKLKSIKWGFWFQILVLLFQLKYYIYEMKMYLGKKQYSEFCLGLDEEVVLQFAKRLKNAFTLFALAIFSIAQLR